MALAFITGEEMDLVGCIHTPSKKMGINMAPRCQPLYIPFVGGLRPNDAPPTTSKVDLQVKKGTNPLKVNLHVKNVYFP